MGLSGDRWLHSKSDGVCHCKRDPVGSGTSVTRFGRVAFVGPSETHTTSTSLVLALIGLIEEESYNMAFRGCVSLRYMYTYKGAL